MSARGPIRCFSSIFLTGLGDTPAKPIGRSRAIGGAAAMRKMGKTPGCCRSNADVMLVRLAVSEAGGFKLLSCSSASVPVGFWSELHKPIVIEVYRQGNIGFPQVGFVGINWHCTSSNSNPRLNSLDCWNVSVVLSTKRLLLKRI